MVRLYEHEPSHAQPDTDPFQFSDDEDEFNYYTDSDEETQDDAESQQQESGHSRLRAFMALIVPLLASGGLGIFLYKKQMASCEAGRPELARNRLKNRVHAVQYEGNALIEDRLSVHEFKTSEGYFVGVFDGHGGW